MKALKWKVISLVFIFQLTSAVAQGQRPDAVIFPKPTPTRLAVADFSPRTSANPETLSALEVFNNVLLDDLQFAAFFDIPSKSFYPLKPLRTPDDLVYENWQVPTLDIDFIAFGAIQADATTTVVEAYLYDIKTRRQVMGKRFTVTDPSLARRVAHEFADQIVYELSAGASKGVATTRILFSKLRGNEKEIWIMDYDGANAERVTFNGGINKFPKWSDDNKFFTYTLLAEGSNRWSIRIQEVNGESRGIDVDGSYAASPEFAPGGKRIVFSASTADSRDADIFVANVDGSGMRNLTFSPGIDTSPTWSPTGTQIAFISDRSGTPQVWIMDSDGSNLRRLVEEGGHCDSPDWSPNGRFILYSWQAPRQWKHDVYLAEVATGKLYQLTRDFGAGENPHWSPDGRHITFQGTRSGTKQLFIMNADGKNLKQITAYGINESPSWNNYSVVTD